MSEKTAVYDRISTNGKCQLFVCYNEYTTLDGGEWNTEIDNFYAVDRKTGKVTAGNKTSWSQPASKGLSGSYRRQVALAARPRPYFSRNSVPFFFFPTIK